MQDSQYCYPASEVLINKLNIKYEKDLFNAEKELTAIRLRELQEKPIKGKYDFAHLKAIHKYIFQDIYSWAGKVRTVEIGKGNLFCTTTCINDYAQSVFNKYFPQCFEARESFDDFVKVFADNYGDLNALHPFREGNGRAKREFARIVCLKCGYEFSLACTTHREMLEASKLSFDKADSTLFIKIFSQAITPLEHNSSNNMTELNILTSDDLTVNTNSGYDYYGYGEYVNLEGYNEKYRLKIVKMESESGVDS